MPRNRRLSIALSDYHHSILERYAKYRSETPTTSATDLLKSKLDALLPELERLEKSDIQSIGDFLDFLTGDKSLSEINLKALAKISGRPVEQLEAIIEQLTTGGRESCCDKEEECAGKNR